MARRSQKEATMGFLIGLLTGAVAVLLYAPKPGDVTREELKVRGEELQRRADELQRVAQDLTAQAKVKKQWETVGKRPGGTSGPSGTQS